MSSINIDPKLVENYINAINKLDKTIKNYFNDYIHEMVRTGKELRNYVFPFFSERNHVLNFIDYCSILSESLIERMCTDFSKFATAVNNTKDNMIKSSEDSKKDLNDTADKNEKQLKEEMDNAYKKWANQSVNSGYDAQRKQALWDEYLKAKKAYEKKTDPLAKYSIDQLAAMVIAGKYGVGDARKKALGSHYAAVQKRVNELMSGYTTKAPQTTAQQRSVTTTQKPTPTTTATQKTTEKPIPTKRMPTETISKRPEPVVTNTPTPKPSVTTAKPAVTTPKPAVTTAKPNITPKPTAAPDPGGIKASDGVKSRLEDEIKRLREQLEKEQQERINLEQRVQQQQQQQQPVVQPQPRATSPSVNPTPAQVVQPEQPTVAPTSTPAPAVVIPSGGDSGSTGSGNTGSGGTGTAYDSPSLPNPNAGDSGSGSSSSSSSGGFNPIPIGIGLGAAVAGGIGVKAYVNHRNNAKFDDENEDSVTNGNRFWTDEDPNVVHTEEDMFNNDSNSKDVSYQAVENNTNGDDTWNIEEQELPDDNSFDLLSESN